VQRSGASQWGGAGQSQWGVPVTPPRTQLLWLIFDSGQRELIDMPVTLGRAPAAVEGSRAVVVPDATMSLSRTHMRLGPTATGAWIEDSFSANGTQIRTPDGRVLVRDLTWRLAPGERIGLVGVNGSGKTTLLRVLAGEYALGTGRRLEGKTVRLGWLRQELDDLDPTMRLLDAVESVASYVQFGKKELSASQLAERLGFSAKRQRTPVGDLSGGERRRLQLTRVLMAEPNVLLLDEPTNDLDIDTLQELESLLDSWPGTLVVISHDRYLIERICDSTWALFGDGHLTNLPGGIDEYLRRRRDMAGSGVTAGGSAVVTEKKRDAASDHKTRKAMTSLERKIAKLQEREQGITAKMAEVATDMDALNELNTELAGVRDEIETLEMEWMELGEQLEG